MCQATVYLDGKEIMKDVTLVELAPEGIRVKSFFEQPVVVEAIIKQIDLLKHRVILESSRKTEETDEHNRETANTDTALDGNNEEHAGEFRQWAEQEATAASADLLAAAEAMSQVNWALAAALEKLGGAASHSHPHSH
ncbi:MAG: CooT family nickel-binding protein [Candidatus Villigracilaceae bacterium]